MCTKSGGPRLNCPRGRRWARPRRFSRSWTRTHIEEEVARIGQPWIDPEGPITEAKKQERIVIFEGEVRTRKELGENWE